MLHPSRALPPNYVKLKRVSKVYHTLYNDSAGKNTMSKCQRTDGFMRKVCGLLYYVHKTTYYRINCNRPCVLVRFHTQRRFCAILSVRTPDSHHPVTYVSQFCTNTPCHKMYPCMSVRSTRHRTLLRNPTILHTKTFFASLSPAQDIPLYDSTLHKTSYTST